MRPAWSDDFEGPAGAAPDARRWLALTDRHPGRGAGERQSYSDRPANVALDGRGRLALQARCEGSPGPGGPVPAYTSGGIMTRDALHLEHGRVAARIRVPAGAGLHAAFRALGVAGEQSAPPACGAVDVMEVVGGRTHVVVGALHGPGPDGATWTLSAEGGAPAAGRPSLADGFHEYAATWAPDRIAFALDGREYARFTPADAADRGRWVFDGPFRLALTLAVGGDRPGPPTDETPFPATMLVDWVRVAGLTPTRRG